MNNCTEVQLLICQRHHKMYHMQTKPFLISAPSLGLGQQLLHRLCKENPPEEEAIQCGVRTTECYSTVNMLHGYPVVTSIWQYTCYVITMLL